MAGLGGDEIEMRRLPPDDTPDRDDRVVKTLGCDPSGDLRKLPSAGNPIDVHTL